MVFAFISSLSSSSAVALIPVDQTQLGDVCRLMDHFAGSEDVGGCPTAVDYPWLCDWSYQWTQLSPGLPAGPPTIHAEAQTHQLQNSFFFTIMGWFWSEYLPCIWRQLRFPVIRRFLWGFYVLSFWNWKQWKQILWQFSRYTMFFLLQKLSRVVILNRANYFQKWTKGHSSGGPILYPRSGACVFYLNKYILSEQNKRQNRIVISDSSPQTTLCAVWWSGTVASLWGSECDLEMVCSVNTGCLQGCACVGGRALLAWEARRSDPLSPTPCLTLPLSPAAQGHVMVWERLMHLQRRAVKSN